MRLNLIRLMRRFAKIDEIFERFATNLNKHFDYYIDDEIIKLIKCFDSYINEKTIKSKIANINY